jgi:hypothetical protein
MGTGHYQAMVYSNTVSPTAPSGLSFGVSIFPSAIAADTGPGSDPVTGFVSFGGLSAGTLHNCRFEPSSPFPGDFFFQAFSYWKDLTPVGEVLQPIHVPTGSPGGQTWFFLLAPYQTMAPTYITFDYTCDNGTGQILQDFNTLVLSVDSTPGPRVVLGTFFSPTSNLAQINPSTLRVNGFGTMRNVYQGGTVTLVIEDFLVNARPALPVEVDTCIIPIGSGNCSDFDAVTPNEATVDLTDNPGTVDREDIRDYRVRVRGDGTPIPYNVLANRLFAKVVLGNGTMVGASSFAVTTE